MRLTCSMFCLLVGAVVAAPAHGEVALWVESSGVMILPDRVVGELKEIRRTAVRNEFVTAQLGLRTDQPADKPCLFEWSALKGPDGNQIGRENVAIFRGAEIEVPKGEVIDETKDKARARRLGRFPDALVPLVNHEGTNVANSILPEKDRTIPFWVDLFIPEKTPAGAYEGTIVLKSAQEELARIPVRVTVLDVAIPADTTFPALFNTGLAPHVRANQKTYFAEIMRHRIHPTTNCFLDWTVKKESLPRMDAWNPDARGYIGIYTYGHHMRDADATIKQLKEAEEYIKARGNGLWDRTFLQLVEQPTKDRAEFWITFCQKVEAGIPEWKDKLHIMSEPLEKISPEIAAMVPHQAMYPTRYGEWFDMPGRKAWDEYRAKGRRLWFYGDTLDKVAGKRMPSFDVHCLNMAWEPRVLGWAYWYEKACGHMSYNITWEPRKKPDGTEVPWSQRNGLYYPGDFTLPDAPTWVLVKDSKGPCVSRRLKHLREGLEELELLKMAERKVGREKVQAVVEKVYTAMGAKRTAPEPWSTDEGAWDKARQEVIDLVMK